MKTIEELEAELAECDCWDDKFDILMDEGFDLPDVPEDVKDESNLIRGCQSSLWAVCSVDNGRLVLSAYSDAVFVRGIISVVKLLVDGKSASDVSDTDIVGWFRSHGLLEGIGLSRRNGIKGLVELIQGTARASIQPPT